MIRSTPAIVAQSAVRRLPRLALLLLCAAYVIPGLIGREPWRGADMATFGYMLNMAQGATSWLDPQMLGMRPAADGLLPYWIGALAVQWGPAWISPVLLVRIPFALMLILTLVELPGIGASRAGTARIGRIGTPSTFIACLGTAAPARARQWLAAAAPAPHRAPPAP